MGITQEIYFSTLKQYLEKSQNILELGAQEYIMNGKKIKYFKNLFNYPITTVDITGENNSMKVNLAEPVEEIMKEKYDVITNFGTSEHVSNQYECWKNIHFICKVGGYVISEIPEKKSWKNHCKYYVDKSFFESLAKDFDIVEYRTIAYSGEGNNCFCILKKKSYEFTTSKEDLEKTIYVDPNFKDKQSV